MATTFFFRAVASDGKVRTGSLAGEDEKLVVRELRKQGLTPIYVGVAPKNAGIEIKLPSFGKGRRRDILFFTQELSTLLNAGVPLDRALSITAELTEKPAFRFIVLDVLRVLKGGRTLADSLATHPDYFSDLYINMVRAGEASGALAIIFERLAEFERTRDELRNYIISSMIYPALLACVGLASITLLLTFVVPRFATIFSDSTMKMPLPTKIMLDVSNVVTAWWWVAALVIASRLSSPGASTHGLPPAGSGGMARVSNFPCWATLCLKPRRHASHAPWERSWATRCRWCNRSASRPRR